MNMDNNQLAKEIRTAIKNGDQGRVLELIDADEKALRISTQFGTWAHVAAKHGKLGILKQLVQRGVDINAGGGLSGGTPIEDAASEGHLEIVNYLLSLGATLEVNISERNPLFSAIYNGHTEVAKALVEAGIDTTVSYSGENLKGVDALAFARQYGRTEIEEILRNSAPRQRMM